MIYFTLIPRSKIFFKTNITSAITTKIADIANAPVKSNAWYKSSMYNGIVFVIPLKCPDNTETAPNSPIALAVPSEAIVPEMGKDKIFLYKSGKAQPVEITTGIRTDRKSVV